MANISNDERNMNGLPVEGEEEEDEEEEEDINIEANIPAETESEPIEIVEEQRVNKNQLLQVICQHHGMNKLKKLKF